MKIDYQMMTLLPLLCINIGVDGLSSCSSSFLKLTFTGALFIGFAIFFKGGE
jgi:hypothetical protein